MTEAPGQFSSNQLVRVIAIILMCLVVFVTFCAVATFGSPSLLLGYWSEHRAAAVVAIMLAIVLIPGLVELAVSRPWRR
jgi:succinate dehydrogenase hydrophobic anchor subunit